MPPTTMCCDFLDSVPGAWRRKDGSRVPPQDRPASHALPEPPSPMRINRTIRRQLAEAIRELEALCDSRSENRCSVPVEHKEAVRLFVETWVLAKLKRALAEIDAPPKKRA